MKYQIRIDEKTYQLEVENHQPGLKITHDGKDVDYDLAEIIPGRLFSLIIEGSQYSVWVQPGANNHYRVFVNHDQLETVLEDERELLRKSFQPEREKTAGSVIIRAPMPGLVTKVEVTVGENVSAGQGVVIVEAMKMENEIKTTCAGVVRKVLVKEGDAIEKEAPLVEIGAPEGEA